MLPIKLHARRKFLERHMNNKSAMAQQVLEFFGELCEIEWEVRALDAPQRLRFRSQKMRGRSPMPCMPR
jgi:hypothetical protein